MAYTKVGIINLALGKLGVKRITLNDGTPQSDDANAIYDYILDEVLQARDWRFAKTRVVLEKSSVDPAYGYSYAYLMPENFLRLALGTPDDPSVYPLGAIPTIPPTDPTGLILPAISKYSYKFETIQLPSGLEKVTNGAFTGAATGWTLGTGWAYGTNNVAKVVGAANTLSQLYGSMVSAPVVDELYLLQFEIVALAGGSITPAVGGGNGTPVSDIGVQQQYIRALSATTGIVFTPSAAGVTCTIDNVSLLKVNDALCLLTDYDDTDYALYITYIKRIIDPTKYNPAFVNALAFRLAAEMSIARTETYAKFDRLMQGYNVALKYADQMNASLDWIPNEFGSDDWESAGR
jgi:hypothetical protein